MLTVFNGAAIAVIGLIIAVILLFLWQLARGLLGPSERTFRLTRRAAWIVALALIGTAAVGVVVDLASPSVTMSVPMMRAWPLPLPGLDVDLPAATVESSGVALAQLTLSGLSMPTRILWAIGQALSLLLPATVAVLVALAARHLEGGAPFSPVLTRTTGVTAAVVLVTGTVAPVLRGIAGSMASFEALTIGGATWSGYPDDWTPQDALPEPTVFVQLDYWPIGAAVALTALTAILKFGQRMQRDTEGLV